uniref:G-patch domain-containing protein n=1 Tax=Elaeophora elaphi TaxID=1147741 RepID=A0A0R3RJS0_9BILA
MNPSGDSSVIGKCKQVRFIRANPVISVQGGITESPCRPTLCGEEVRSFYETLLAEPSTSVVPDVTMAAKLKSIKNSNQHFRKFTKLSNKISMKQDDVTNNSEQLFKDAANGNLRGVMDYYCGKGMDVNVSDQYGWTPLMCASYAGHLHIVKYLLSVGADVLKRSKSGETAADFALRCGHREVYRHIFSHDKEESELQSKSSLQKVKGSEKDAEITRFCDACQCTYVGEAHLSSVAHLLETRRPVLDPGYGIPEWNKGYRILRRSGWDEFEGLGRNATGRRYPVKTVLKRDRFGLGCDTFDVPKVTHFKANDVQAVKVRPTKRGNEMKERRKRILHEKILEHHFRSMFRND